ncbi:unknown [Clostridium sp. CAG:1013]|nr:unknown [Clostridium sp. CAG:1013]
MPWRCVCPIGGNKFLGFSKNFFYLQNVYDKMNTRKACREMPRGDCPSAFALFKRSSMERSGGHGIRDGIHFPNGTAHPQPGPSVYPEGRRGCGHCYSAAVQCHQAGAGDPRGPACKGHHSVGSAFRHLLGDGSFDAQRHSAGVSPIWYRHRGHLVPA